MPDPETERFEFTIDGHKTRCEVRCSQGEWSAYVFIDPVNEDEQHDQETARTVLPKLLRKLADGLKKR